MSRRAWIPAALVVMLAAALLAPSGSSSAPEPRASTAKAFGGSLTLNFQYTQGDRDITIIGVQATGRVKTRRICANLRTIDFKILNPPSGKPRVTPFDVYAIGHKYYGSVVPPRKAGTYDYRAIAFKTPVARGLKRANCKTLRSPVKSIVVPPAGP